jgi:hypothetical protein
MIVQDERDQLTVIRQTDHSLLSGFFAREWGNQLFKRPEPFDSFCLAAREHDNGWREWELLPELDPKTRLPYSFMSIPTRAHMELYQHGIERVVKVDRYAGLLVSMHCSELYDRTRATLPGYSAKYVKSNESELVTEFVQQLRLQQLRLKVDLRAAPATKNFSDEKALQTNLRRLEALDRLSLFFCMGPPEEATFENVPVDDESSEVDLEVRFDGKNTVSLTPYPFRKDPLDVSILARRVPKRLYADDPDFQRTLATTAYFGLNFKMCAGNALAHTRIA